MATRPRTEAAASTAATETETETVTVIVTVIVIVIVIETVAAATAAETTEAIADVTVGCAYRNRCPRAEEQCATITPPPIPAGDGRAVRCHFPLRAHERDDALTPPP